MERALLVTVELDGRSDWTAEERSVELAELASSAGAGIAAARLSCPSVPSVANIGAAFTSSNMAQRSLANRKARDEALKIEEKK